MKVLLDQLAHVVPDLHVHRFGGPADEIPPGEEDWAPYTPDRPAGPYEYMAHVCENPPAVIIP